MDQHLATETVLTTQSEATPLRSLKTLVSEEIFPVYRDFIPLSCPTERILEGFHQVCKTNGFKVTYESSHRLVAMHSPRFSIKKYFSCIIGEKQEGVTQVELQIKIMAFPNQKLISAQGLQGCKMKQALLINSFKAELSKVLINRDLYYHDQPSLQRVSSEVSNFLMTRTGQDLLTSLQNSLKEKYELRQIKVLVAQVIRSSFNHYPTSVKSIYLKSLEKVVFSKFSEETRRFYSEKMRETQEKFEEKIRKFQEMQNFYLFERLLFKEKFKLADDPAPYAKPINMLRELKKKIIPLEKLNLLYEIHVALRTTVLEYSKGKEELEAMDDILPVYIFIIIKAAEGNLPVDIALLQDYIRVSQDMESEERLVVNYYVAVQYVLNECF
jgi:hypothetical protein